MNNNDKVIVAFETDKPDIKEAIFHKHVKGGFVELTVDGHRDIYNAYGVFPLEAKEELTAILMERQTLKKAFDDSISLLFKLRNKYPSKSITDKG